jgi:hypothetical protein
MAHFFHYASSQAENDSTQPEFLGRSFPTSA